MERKNQATRVQRRVLCSQVVSSRPVASAAIAKAITLVESSRKKDKEESKELISKLILHPGHSVRIGFSGSPGVGKSTFIESFGSYLVDKGYRLGILAIDPSSQLTGGSILGDKTRMSEISKNENTFIRSTPSRGSLGGVCRKNPWQDY